MKTLREMMDIVEGSKKRYSVRMNAQMLGSTSRSRFDHTVEADSEEQAKVLAVEHAKKRGFDNISVRQVTLLDSELEEEATPEAVEKINKLYQDKQ